MYALVFKILSCDMLKYSKKESIVWLFKIPIPFPMEGRCELALKGFKGKLYNLSRGVGVGLKPKARLMRDLPVR